MYLCLLKQSVLLDAWKLLTCLFLTGLYVYYISCSKEKAPWEMSKQEKIDVAGKRKEDGNTLFKSGNYQRALKKYNKVNL